MKIPVIKQLVEKYSLDELTAAEAAIAEGETPPVTIDGDDEGEQLTHAYAAMYIRRLMDEEGTAFPQALRQYTQMVRGAIS